MGTNIRILISVHINRKTIKYYQCDDGFFFHNLKDVHDNVYSSNANKTKSTVIFYSTSDDNRLSFLNSLNKNKSIYNKKKIKSADEALNCYNVSVIHQFQVSRSI